MMEESSEKKNERQTKAGMLGKASSSQAASEREEATDRDENGSTPKIGKEEAEDQGRERPLH